MIGLPLPEDHEGQLKIYAGAMALIQALLELSDTDKRITQAVLRGSWDFVERAIFSDTLTCNDYIHILLIGEYHRHNGDWQEALACMHRSAERQGYDPTELRRRTVNALITARQQIHADGRPQ